MCILCVSDSVPQRLACSPPETSVPSQPCVPLPLLCYSFVTALRMHACQPPKGWMCAAEGRCILKPVSLERGERSGVHCEKPAWLTQPLPGGWSVCLLGGDSAEDLMTIRLARRCETATLAVCNLLTDCEEQGKCQVISRNHDGNPSSACECIHALLLLCAGAGWLSLHLLVYKGNCSVHLMSMCGYRELLIWEPAGVNSGAQVLITEEVCIECGSGPDLKVNKTLTINVKP